MKFCLDCADRLRTAALRIAAIYVVAVFGLVCAVPSAALAAAGAPSSRPNIVVIMADDLGFSDLGCYGSEIATPHLDRLAAGGLRFTQFYNTARCCPTRAALLTGLYPHQAGMGHMEVDFGQAGYRGYLNDRCVTIAEVLRTAGYRTCMAGKWNVGPTRPHWPVDRGFEHYFGLLRGAADYFDPRVGPRARPDAYAEDDHVFSAFGDDFYATDAFTDHAVRWIDDAPADAPFFLYVAYTAPHSPLQARPEDIAKYRGKYRAGWDELRPRRHARQIELGLVDAQTPLPPRDRRVPAWSDVKDQDYEDLKMSVFAAQVDRLDQGIGRIVAALERKGALQDTLMLFLSDNGGDGERESSTKDLPPGPKASSHIYGRGWAQLSNTPFRGYKHESLEGGIATPLIAHWPRAIRTAGVTHEPGHVIDIMATCVDVAGAAYPKHRDGREIAPLEGKSLADIFRAGRRTPHAALYWEHEGHRAVRQGRWKLVALHGEPWQLYDLAADRGEAHDLAASDPGKVHELTVLYSAWAERSSVLPWSEISPKKK